MSNFLAIATVTETLRFVLDHYVSQDVTGATATSVRPSGLNNTGAGNGLPATGVNLALYQIIPAAVPRDLDLPTRRSDGTLIQRPRAAIDLHYLLSVYGSDATLEPHRVMGTVVRTLNTYPFLSREFIQEAVTGASFLNGSDLASEIELVKFVPLGLTLDELSRVWSVYFQTSYALSVCYQASVVYLEDTSSPSLSLPVRNPNIVATTIMVPSVLSISPQPATAGAVITISGPNVGVAGTNVVIGDANPAPATIVNNQQITYALPATTQAGVSPLSVVQLVNFGTTSTPDMRSGVESVIAPMALAATITNLPLPSVARGGTLTVNVDTPVGRSQQVALILGATTVPLPGRLPTDPATSDSFTFTIPPDIAPGTLLVRVRVDGVDSALTYDPTTKQYTQPSVAIT
jgi:Pvc16 N-terminal domain/IPT/TIG domain